ncbi:MAG: hypothetical protein BZ138_07335 [Methanosphaera sp. rholeuAM270]|nr:MAG: hypothetical protein BZ138_07335 [Methanosphaera sp. rholeuAM270]
MRNSYEENIVDIIHALHELRRLSAPEILAIKETSESINPHTMAMYEIFHIYERLYKEYMKEAQMIIIETDEKHETTMWSSHLKEEKKEYPSRI